MKTEYHAVCRPAWVIDRLLVGQQAADDTAELQQRMPLTAISRQPGRIHGKDDAHFPVTDGLKHGVEAGPPDGAGA